MFDSNTYKGLTPSYSELFCDKDYIYVKYNSHGWFRYSNKIIIDITDGNKYKDFFATESTFDVFGKWSSVLNIINYNPELGPCISPTLKEPLPNKIVKFLSGKSFISLIRFKHEKSNKTLEYEYLSEIEDPENPHQLKLIVKYASETREYKRSFSDNCIGWELVNNTWYPIHYSEIYKTFISGYCDGNYFLSSQDQIILPPKIVEFLKFRSLYILVVPKEHEHEKSINPPNFHFYQNEFGLILKNDTPIYWDEKNKLFTTSTFNHTLSNTIKLHNDILKKNLKIICIYYNRKIPLIPWIDTPSYIKQNILIKYDLSELKINYVFKNILFITEALTHNSYQNVFTSSHQRLSMIGKVLIKYVLYELLLGDIVINEEINIMTGISDQVLAWACVKLKLHTYILIDRTNKNLNSLIIMADTFAGLLGAILLDGTWESYNVIKKLVHQYVLPLLFMNSTEFDDLFSNFNPNMYLYNNEPENLTMLNWKLCKYCNISCNSKNQYTDHCNSFRHLKKISSLDSDSCIPKSSIQELPEIKINNDNYLLTAGGLWKKESSLKSANKSSGSASSFDINAPEFFPNYF
jgi:hypothetical protein